MRAIRLGRSQHYFGIARQLDLSRLQRSVRQNYPPDFRRVVRCDRDFRDGINVAIAPDESDAVAGEQHAIPLWLGSRWLVRGRPDMSAAQVLHVAPLAIVVARRVVTPPGNGQVSVAAESTAGVGDQHCVRHVAKNSNHWLWCMRCLDLADCRLLRLARHPGSICPRDILHDQPPRNPFLQYELR